MLRRRSFKKSRPIFFFSFLNRALFGVRRKCFVRESNGFTAVLRRVYTPVERARGRSVSVTRTRAKRESRETFTCGTRAGIVFVFRNHPRGFVPHSQPFWFHSIRGHTHLLVRVCTSVVRNGVSDRRFAKAAFQEISLKSRFRDVYRTGVSNPYGVSSTLYAEQSWALTR